MDQQWQLECDQVIHAFMNANDKSGELPEFGSFAYQAAKTSFLKDLAKKSSELLQATHILKGVHSQAKGPVKRVNILAIPQGSFTSAVSTDVLGNAFTMDVVGNAANLRAYKFLRLVYDGKTFLQWMQEKNKNFLRVLHEDQEQALLLCHEFLKILEGSEHKASHTLGKQVYWVSRTAQQSFDYTLISPLYPTSLVHAVYNTIQTDRFGESAKAAREAKRKKLYSAHGYNEYPNLAVQRIGGDNAQNVSQLNSERGGNSFLLASLPPIFQPQKNYNFANCPHNTPFAVWGKYLKVWINVDEVGKFLKSDPLPNMHTRDRRDVFTHAIISHLLQLSKMAHMLPAGWSTSAQCQLAEHHVLWLDPKRAEIDQAFREKWLWSDWTVSVAEDYARWFNNELKRFGLPVDDSAFSYWKKEFSSNTDWLDFIHHQAKQIRAFNKISREQI